MSLNINHPAPLFESFNSEKQPFSLEQLKGKNVLLLFFPAAFTSTCTKELCSVRDNLSYYNNLNCTVIGISTDTIYSLAKYKEEQKLNFQLVSDFNKEIGKIYGYNHKLLNCFDKKNIVYFGVKPLHYKIGNKYEKFDELQKTLINNYKNLELFAKIQNLFDRSNGLWISDDVIHGIFF